MGRDPTTFKLEHPRLVAGLDTLASADVKSDRYACVSGLEKAMASRRTIKEYRDERASYGKQRFLALYPFPVLLTADTRSAVQPGAPGSSGFFTKSQNDSTAPSTAADKQSPLAVSNAFIVIPIVKNAGHPFPERIGVGRTKGTDITLADREVSKYQGYFSAVGDRWSFTDGGSSNGSFVRGERLVQMVTTPLEDGIEIGFGSGRYVFRTAEGFCDFLDR